MITGYFDQFCSVMPMFVAVLAVEAMRLLTDITIQFMAMTLGYRHYPHEN